MKRQQMTRVAPSRILAFVLAGGEGRRLRPLTAACAKPAVQFAGNCRIIDFVLANLVNSRIAPIYVLVQYKPDTLLEHLKSAWSPHWEVRARLPSTAEGYRGTADAVYRNLHLIERHRPDAVAVFAADQVYRMDIRQMAGFHAVRGADVTVAALPVPIARAGGFGVMAVNEEGVIEEFQEKPTAPRPIPGSPHLAYASMGNYIFKPQALSALLAQVIACGGTDFGPDVLPTLPGSRYMALAYDFSSNEVPGVRAYEARAYWRDVGTVDALDEARLDASGPRPRLALCNPAWPMRPAVAPASRDLAACVSQYGRLKCMPSHPAVTVRHA